jgi:hypothetical protein
MSIALEPHFMMVLRTRREHVKCSSLIDATTQRSDLQNRSDICDFLADSVPNLSRHKLLSSVSFENGSELTPIEQNAFSESDVEAIAIPHHVQILCSFCFSSCRSLSSVSFEVDMELRRIGSNASSLCASKSITTPCHVQILRSLCFCNRRAFSSILFEIGSKLTRIEAGALANTALKSITIPRHVQFIVGSTSSNLSHILTSIDLDISTFVVESGFLLDTQTARLVRILGITSEMMSSLVMFKLFVRHVLHIVDHFHQFHPILIRNRHTSGRICFRCRLSSRSQFLRASKVCIQGVFILWITFVNLV